MISKNQSKYFFTTSQLIEIQSSIYYRLNDNLGFDTLANKISEYAKAVANMIIRIRFISKEEAISILELGPGTLFFAKIVIEELNKSKVKFKYTVVDVNVNLKSKCDNLGINLINKTFNNFSKSSNTKFDFLIMNQALDMWAGNNFIINKKSKNSIYWKLYDKNKNKFVSKEELQLLSLNSDIKEVYWIKFYKRNKHLTSSLKYLPNRNETIFLPYHFYKLLQKVKLGGFIQDYWNLGSNVQLRSGLMSKDCTAILTSFPLNEQREILEKNYTAIIKRSTLLSIIKNEQTNLINWFESNIIPFAIRDVTYSPEIMRVISLIENSFNYEILTLKKFIEKLLSVQEADKINENDFGVEKNILFFEKKFLAFR